MYATNSSPSNLYLFNIYIYKQPIEGTAFYFSAYDGLFMLGTSTFCYVMSVLSCPFSILSLSYLSLILCEAHVILFSHFVMFFTSHLTYRNIIYVLCQSGLSICLNNMDGYI